MNPAIWVIVFAFVVVLLEFIVSFDEKRKPLWRGLIVISAVLILGFGVTAQNQQEAFNNDRINFEKQLDSKNEEITKITRELANKSDEISKKSDTIATLSRENASMATGGDSFCYLGFVFGVGAANTPSLVVIQDGKYPLQNIKIIITDMKLFKSTFPDMPTGTGRSYQRPITIEELEKADNINVIFDVDALGPPGSMLRMRPGWKLPERDQVTYSVKMLTQFQTFYQNLKLRKVNGRWTTAFRVTKYGPDKKLIVLREHIPSDFPRDQSGKVSW